MTVFFSNSLSTDVTLYTKHGSSFRDNFERDAYNKYKSTVQEAFLCNNHFRYEERISHALLSPENIQRLLSNISTRGFKTTAYPLEEGNATSIVVSLCERDSSQGDMRSASPGWDLSFNAREAMQKLTQELETHAQKVYAEMAVKIVTAMQEKSDISKYNFSLRAKSRSSCSRDYRIQIAKSLVEELKEKGFQATFVESDSEMPIIQVINAKAKSVTAPVSLPEIDILERIEEEEEGKYNDVSDEERILSSLEPADTRPS